MAGTLLVGSPGTSWRDWLRHNRKGRDLVIADPMDSMLGPAGRIGLWRGEQLAAWRFYGSLSPLRAPHMLLAAAVSMVRLAQPDPIIQLFPYRPGPLMRQLTGALAEILQPSQILLASDAQLDLCDWPVGPEEVELPAAFPSVVETAQRRAQWLKLLEHCATHEVPLRNLAIEGARLGSGRSLGEAERKAAGIEAALHAECCGATLFVVSDGEFEDLEVSRALDSTHTSKFQVVRPEQYKGLLCSFARSGGEDFGYGVLDEIDFGRGVAFARTTAVPPTPVQVLRIGGLKLTEDGVEQGEIRPWEV